MAGTFKFGGKNQYKVGSFTIDTTTASGTQAITGVGFTPRAGYFFACQDGAVGEMSLGISDANTHKSIGDDHNILADTYNSEVAAIADREAAGDLYKGQPSSWDSDGFTITWTKTGTPSGTLTVLYLVIV